MPKPRNDFIQERFHTLYGQVLEALTWSARDKEDLSRTMNRIRNAILTDLGDIYDEFVPPNRPAPEPPKAAPSRGSGPLPPGAK